MQVGSPGVGIADIGGEVFDEALGGMGRRRLERPDRLVQSRATRPREFLASSHILRSALLLLCMITSFIIHDVRLVGRAFGILSKTESSPKIAYQIRVPGFTAMSSAYPGQPIAITSATIKSRKCLNNCTSHFSHPSLCSYG